MLFLSYSNTNPSEEKKTHLPLLDRKKTFLEGNQGGLLQIMPNGATSMLVVLPSSAPECKTVTHDRISGRTRC